MYRALSQSEQISSLVSRVVLLSLHSLPKDRSRDAKTIKIVLRSGGPLLACIRALLSVMASSILAMASVQSLLEPVVGTPVGRFGEEPVGRLPVGRLPVGRLSVGRSGTPPVGKFGTLPLPPPTLPPGKLPPPRPPPSPPPDEPPVGRSLTGRMSLRILRMLPRPPICLLDCLTVAC